MAQVVDLEPAATRTENRVLLLADARTTTERALLQGWAQREHPGAELLELGDPQIAARVNGPDDPLVLPARVTWLPPREEGGRHAADALLLLDPRRPSARLQTFIARRRPERVQITAGAPARAAELQRRFRTEEGGGPEALTAFVGRQATLACDRAERAVIGDRYKVPRLVAEQIAASARFRDQASRLAQQLDRSLDDVLDDAVGCLSELATVQSPLAIDAFRAVVRPMHARAWTVEADRDGLERLREANRRHALVFLPTHRSYVDPLVLADVLHDADFPRNHLLGGDNMSFWPLGPLGKRAGVIFIRRQFGDDKVYRLAVKEFFGHLVAKRFNLEWYIEGGRTRTGKLRPPRYGLLHYLAAAIDEGRAEDALLVPTSIVYDRLHEVATMAAEHSGAAKRREGLHWMLDYIRAQRANVGTARVDFGEPFSLREALAEAGGGPARLEKVAFRICDGINRITPVTKTSLVSFVLLGTRDRALTLREMANATAPLLDLLEERGVPGPIAELRKPADLRAGLDALTDAGAVRRYDGGEEPVWSLAPDGHTVAAFYRNGALHHLVLRAIVELVLLHLSELPEGADPIEESWLESLRLRDLLKFEFFFADKPRFREELRAEVQRLSPDWEHLAAEPGGAAKLLADCRAVVAHRTLRSFVDAQLVVARRLAARDPRQAVDRDAFLDECLGHGRQLVLQGRLHGSESVSRELFGGALKLAANRDLVDPGRDEVRESRERWLAEVEDVVDRLRTIEQLDRAALEEVLGDVAG